MISNMGLIDARALNGEPGTDRHLVASKGLIAPINQRSNIWWETGELCPPEEPVEHVRGHGIARFDFDRVKKICFFDQEVDFVPCPIAPEENRGCSSVVQIGFGDLCDHVVLENRPPERMRNDLGSLTDAQKLAEQTCIVEVELGAFDYSLAEVPVMGREQEDDEACLEHGDPAARRVYRDAAVRCQARVAEELSGSPGAKRQEPFEDGEVADVRQAPHIALDVGLDVVRKPHIGRDPAVVYPGDKSPCGGFATVGGASSGC